MNIGKILEVTGKSALKNIPLGGVIVDVAELMIGDRFDKKTVSGDDIKQAVETLSPTAKAEFLAKTLDVDARMLESTNMLKQKMEADTPVSRARSVIAMGIAIMLLVLSAGFGLMLGHAYITGGLVPSIESLLVVFGLPTVALLAFFGLDTKAFQEVIMQVVTRSIVRKSLK